MTALVQHQVKTIPAEVTMVDLEGAYTVRLALSGLRGVNCANRVHDALLSCPGVVDSKVDLDAAQADVRYLPEQIGPVGLKRVVSNAAKGTPHRYRAAPSRDIFPPQ
jgi:copper chaperone CopZ